MYPSSGPPPYGRPLPPPPPQGYYHHHHDPPLSSPPFPGGSPPPSHHHRHPGYWPPDFWTEQYPPFHEELFGYPTTTDTPYDSGYCSPLDTSRYSLSEIGDSLASSRCHSKPTSPPNEREIEDTDSRSVDSGDGTRAEKKRWSTMKQPLPSDARLAARIEKRRKTNRIATQRSRCRLVEKALKGDRYERVLMEVGDHLENIAEELRKLHTVNVSELLRQAGVDTGLLVGEINKLTEYITKEVKGTLDSLS